MLQFEKQTKTSSIAIINEYLKRCDREPGDIYGLMSSSSEDQDDSYYDQDESNNEGQHHKIAYADNQDVHYDQ